MSHPYVARLREHHPIAKVGAGEHPNFTGIDSAYEPPQNPDIRLATIGHDPETLADRLVEELRRRAILA